MWLCVEISCEGCVFAKSRATLPSLPPATHLSTSHTHAAQPHSRRAQGRRATPASVSVRHHSPRLTPSRHGGLPPVQYHLGAALHSLVNQRLRALQRRGRDHGAHVHAGRVAGAELKPGESQGEDGAGEGAVRGGVSTVGEREEVAEVEKKRAAYTVNI